MTGPEQIGPRRAQWWRRFPQGYRIEYEERMKWTGRFGGSTIDHGVPHLPRLHACDDQCQFQRVLDSHNIGCAEWFVLSAVDDLRTLAPRILGNTAVKRATSQLGMTVSREECYAAVDSCLAYGWLRALDDVAIREIDGFLQRDPTINPVRRRDYDKIDFTQDGVALYQLLATELFGPEWDAQVTVEKEIYRKEQRYSATEAGVLAALQEYAAETALSASEPAPIGPWCVYWWKQFTAGYRIDLEIGIR